MPSHIKLFHVISKNFLASKSTEFILFRNLYIIVHLHLGLLCLHWNVKLVIKVFKEVIAFLKNVFEQ